MRTTILLLWALAAGALAGAGQALTVGHSDTAKPFIIAAALFGLAAQVAGRVAR